MKNTDPSSMNNSAPEILENTFSELKDDPEYLNSLIDKHVEVQLIKNVSFCGFVQEIDPISQSIILSVPKNNQYQSILIPGHAVKNVYEKFSEKLPPPRKAISPGFEEGIMIRKTKLLAWFKQNMLPVTEKGENIVVGSVSVLPPYRSSNIYAQNTVVALQIRKIMDKMPENFAIK